MKAQEFRKLIREEIANTLSEATESKAVAAIKDPAVKEFVKLAIKAAIQPGKVYGRAYDNPDAYTLQGNKFIIDLEELGYEEIWDEIDDVAKSLKKLFKKTGETAVKLDQVGPEPGKLKSPSWPVVLILPTAAGSKKNMVGDDIVKLVNSPDFDSMYTITTKSNGDIVISANK